MVKTRLTESLSSTAVIALYRCLLEDTLELTNSLNGVEVAVVCPEPDKEELAQLVGSGISVVAQKGEGLAAGLNDPNAGLGTVGAFADLAVLSADYLRVPEDEIRSIESVLTLTAGRVVYAAAPFASLAPALPPVAPDWSPVSRYGGVL